LGIAKRAVVIIVVVGALLTVGGFYFLCFMPSVPSVAEKAREIVDSSQNANMAEERLRELMVKEKGIASVEIEGFGNKESLVLERELQSEAPVIKITLPFSHGIITVGLEKRTFYSQSIGVKMVIFGVAMVLVFCLVILFVLQGVNERLISIASYLKEAEPEELDEMTMENWPPEIKQVVASIDIFLKRVEKRLKLKVEEARRDRLFVHNAMVELVECLNQAAQGDLRVRAETSADIVGALGEAFNDAVAILENRVADAQKILNQIEKALEDKCEDSEELMEEIARAKRALFYFRTEITRRIERGTEGGDPSSNQREPEIEGAR
jgi:methyl-accepting chemotaxis protein